MNSLILQKIHPFIRLIIPLCLLTILSACSSVDRSSARNTQLQNQVTKTALQQIGKPYKYGGNAPNKGFDCSGLVYYSYAKAGVKLPRSSDKQYAFVKKVRNPQKGDLLFFSPNGRKISHVGIYLGNREMLHAPGKGRKVEITSIDYDYWKKHYEGAGTIL